MLTLIKYAVGALFITLGLMAEYALYMSFKLFEESFISANIAIVSGASIQDYLIPVIALIQGGNIAPISLSASLIVAVIGILLIMIGCQFIFLTKKNKSLKVLLSKAYWLKIDLSTDPKIDVKDRDYEWFDNILVALRLKPRKISKIEIERKRSIREKAHKKEMERLRSRALAKKAVN